MTIETPSTFAKPCWTSSLREVAHRWDSWIVDQWGVLHNGVQPYAGAAETLRRLVARGDTVIVLSNSGKRSEPNVQRLARMGFDRSCYTELLTSGEVVRSALIERPSHYYAELGPRCWLVSNDGDTGVLDGLDIQRTTGPADADFVLLCGVGDAHELSHYDAQFRLAAGRGLPMICANPDFVRFVDGELKLSCGALARRYESLGGAVRWLGKPFPEVYLTCCRLLEQRGARQTAVIGDSLEHDIAGGQATQLGTVFLTGGIHRAEFAAATDRDTLLREQCSHAGLSALPDVVMGELAW